MDLNRYRQKHRFEKVALEKKKQKRMIRIDGSRYEAQQLDYSNRKTGDGICHTTTLSKDMPSPGRLSIRKEFEYDPVGSFRRSGPFALVFVYPKDEMPFVAKGGWTQVENWLKKVFRKPAVIHKTFWKHGFCTQYYDIVNFVEDDSFFAFDKMSNGKYVLTNWNRGYKSTIATFRRVPRKWIKQLDDIRV